MLGIGGVGVSGVARVLLERGVEVSGSDVRESQLTLMLRGLGAQVFIGHRAENLDGASVVVVSTAIPAGNVELVEAQRRGVPVVHRAQVLAALIEGRHAVGVTGTHGKGTVSTMITWILDQAGLEPGFIIGALPHNYGVNARDGAARMVVEIDESDGSHLKVFPQRVVCNFLELDHLNYYKDIDDIVGAMRQFVTQNPSLERLYVNADCAGNLRMIEGLPADLVRTYAVENRAADLRGELVGKGQLPIRFKVWRGEDCLGEVSLPLPGRYNVVNACGALLVALDMGVEFEVAARALGEFKGLENRFTLVQAGGVWLVKDYISHPTGMRKVLESARDLVTGRVISVFKPYRYTLMKYLEDEYATAFEGSDEILITTMYAANEPPIPGVDTDSFVARLRASGYKVTYLPEQEDVRPWVVQHARPGDVVLFFGGDDFFRLCDRTAVELEAR
jgi:UDP-N-acetylmuramate--alanine ligase